MSTPRPFDLVIIGGGIVGLAAARAALDRYPRLRLLLLDKEAGVARHQTGHNSGVIHSGVYYKPGSLKARFCVEGARAMIGFCREQGIAHQLRGKVIVAARERELPALREVFRRGEANGVPGLAMLSRDQLLAIEPHAASVAGPVAAVRVPDVAIVDYAAVAGRCAELLAAAGGELRLQTEVIGLRTVPDGLVIETNRGDIAARGAINCAGLHADRILALAAPARRPLAILPFRGEYYELAPAAAALVHGLIYPVPDARFPFLGVHFTPRIAGGVEAGPNAVLALRREGYGKCDADLRDVWDMARYPGFWAMAARYWRKGLMEEYRSLRRAAFVRALQRLLPALRDADVRPGGSGVRAQVVLRNGRLMDDFAIVRQGACLHVLNVPSPAATASLVIGRHIAEQLP